MPDDFEEQLRRSLAARAGDVSPDPAMFARVQARIRRGRTFRFALAGVAGSIALAGVAFAAPALMNRRVQFVPGPVATAPPAEATLAPSPTPVTQAGVPSFVYSRDGSGASSLHLGGEGDALVLDETMKGVGAVDVRPSATSTPLDVAVTDAGGGGCPVVKLRSYAVGPGDVARDASTASSKRACATTPRFSPDGGHVAWAAVGAGWTVEVARWVDGQAVDVTSFGLPWPAQQPVDIQDWVWTEEGETATGYLVVRTMMDGGWVLVRMPIERQVDGAVATRGGLQPLTSAEGGTPVAFSAGGPGDNYTLEVDFAAGGPRDAYVVWRRNDRVVGGFSAGDGVLAGGDAFDAYDLWMSASPSGVLFGNSSAEAAWWMPFPGTGDPARKGATPAMPPQELDESVIFGSLVPPATGAVAGEAPTDPPLASPTEPAAVEPAVTKVDVFFGMAGADACTARQSVVRQVEGPAVARGALNELLEGPTSRESNEGIETPFNANTAGALRDIAIVDGQARVDLRDFSDVVGTDSCTKSSILDSLDKTLLQFPTITSTRYSFDGSVEAFQAWLGSDTEHTAVPPEVQRTADLIRGAAQTKDWVTLDDLSKETSCTLSDQPEPCVPVWKEQERNGEDPLGTLALVLEGSPARAPDTEIWAWPAAWFEDKNYSGPRVGIDADGRWLYFVQEGG